MDRSIRTPGHSHDRPGKTFLNDLNSRQAQVGSNEAVSPAFVLPPVSS